jgi:rhodanese-related sulfurtransferase
MCGKQIGKETVSTIGVERQYNYALQPMTRDAFLSIVTADQPEPPQYFSYDAVLNKKEHPTLEETLARTLKPLSVDVVLALMEVGAQALDVREPADFAGAHLAGSINIPLGGQYASWAGTVLSHDRPIVIVAEPGREEEAAVRLGRIGYDQVTGFLRGGMQTLDGHPSLVERTDRITAATLAEQLASDQPPLVLDVRSAREWQTKRIEGSLNVPLNRLLERLVEVPREGRIVVHCASGYRSSIGASLLARDHRHVVDLVGGISAWEAARLPLLAG